MSPFLDFIRVKGDGGGGDNWSYKTEIKLSPPTSQLACYNTVVSLFANCWDCCWMWLYLVQDALHSCRSVTSRMMCCDASSRSSWSGEIRQVMWHVVAGSHHVYPVSIFHDAFCYRINTWMYLLLLNLSLLWHSWTTGRASRLYKQMLQQFPNVSLCFVVAAD